ncbi:MAG: hypothetical protein EXR53_06225 [Dehalococcoidia bacterium]|nr:hypothetical protein [Dehalococcoidia bacterium]
MPERKTKIIKMEDVPAFLKDALSKGGRLLIGGNGYGNRPNALVRQIVTAGIRNLSLFGGPVNANDVDMLVAVGAVKETFCPMVSALQFGMAPNWRKAAETGTIVANGIDQPSTLAGLMAADLGIPYMPLACMKGTDLVKVHPLLKKYTPPFGGEDLYAVQAIRPDLAIIHAPAADIYGNVRDGSRGSSHLVAKASQRVLVSVDRIIPYEETLRNPEETTIPCRYVAAVVEIPYGAHPAGCTGGYAPDTDHLREYWQAAASNAQGDTKLFQAYLDKYVLGPSSNFDYMERIGGAKRLWELQRGASAGAAE